MSRHWKVVLSVVNADGTIEALDTWQTTELHGTRITDAERARFQSLKNEIAATFMNMIHDRSVAATETPAP